MPGVGSHRLHRFEAHLLQHSLHVQAEVFVREGLGALHEQGDGFGEALDDGGARVVVSDGQGAAWGREGGRQRRTRRHEKRGERRKISPIYAMIE